MAVYKRGENYYIDFYLKSERIREKIGPSRKSAGKILAKRRVEVIENKYLDVRKESKPIKFYDFAVEYVGWSKTNKKPSSLERERSLMRQLDDQFGARLLHKITSWDVEKYKARRKKVIKRPGAVVGCSKKKNKDGRETDVWFVDYKGTKGKTVRKIFGSDQLGAQTFFNKSNLALMPATVNRELALLKHMYSKAIEWGKAKENPAKKVELLKGEVRRVRFLLPAEIHKLLSNCAEDLRPIVTVAVNTGMRKGELLNLKWKDVNLEQGIISLLDTKNNERRDIPMDETARKVFQDLDRTGEYVFGKGDRHIFARRKSFDSAVRESGISDFRFHDLRHTFASNLVMEGVDIMTVKELMGHKTLDMTLRYAHLAPNHKTRAVTVLDRIMSEKDFYQSQGQSQAAEASVQVTPINRVRG